MSRPMRRLLIVEFILPPLVDRADPNLEIRLIGDLNMLAVTGGKERGEPEWQALLETASVFRVAGVYLPGARWASSKQGQFEGPRDRLATR
jgi:hypothetical protein